MPSGNYKLVFLGTPDFAVPTLRALTKKEQFSVIGVVTQPDKPAGRGAKLTAPPVKIAALDASIPVFQPESLKGISFADGSLKGPDALCGLLSFLNLASPVDAFVTVAYGKLIPEPLLDYARCGTVNIHPSLLPRWRGAAPLQRALLNGDPETGVSLMKLDKGLDTGPVYCRQRLAIERTDTLGSLHDKLAVLGAEYLTDKLPDILSGALKPVLQEENGATYAEKWEKRDCEIDWSEPLDLTLRRIRACCPSPGAETAINQTPLKIFAAHQVPDKNYISASPGAIVEVNRREIIVAAGENNEFVSLDELQFPGKKRLPASEILKGKSFEVGWRFSLEGENCETDSRTVNSCC